MSKTKSTKRALLMSVLSLLLCVSMLIGTTYAWFTDTATSAGNKIVAGTLDVDLLMYDAAKKDYIDISANEAAIFGNEESLVAKNNNGDTLWEPGKTQVAYLAIKNNGNLALKYKVALDVVNPEGGKNLYKAMEYAIYADKQNGEITAWDGTNAKEVTLGTQTVSNGEGEMKPGDTHYFALAVHMKEEAGNEYQGGMIDFDMTVLATQLASEEDSFNNQYDAEATYPVIAYGKRVSNTWFDIYDVNTDSKIGSATVLEDSIANPEKETIVRIVETEADGRVTVESDQKATTYEITVENLKEGNTEPVKIELYIGEGQSGVELYHNDALIDSTYDPTTGYLKFASTSFSPFTVVYDAEPVIVDVETPEEDETTGLPEGMPVAIVTDADQYENTALEWGSYGGFSPSDENQQLESAYVFKSPHNSDNIGDCAYKNWYCDYVVKMDRDVALGDLFLGGNYGLFGWVGFENPIAVAAEQEVPLLGSVTSNPWTYADVASFVGEFICGVAHLDDSLDGATFTVMLRLTNPENPDEYYNVNTVTYTFE